MKVASLASALRAEVRRVAAKEMKKALRPVATMQRQLNKLRGVSRAQKKAIRAVERGFERMQQRVGAVSRRRGARGGLSADGIRALRSQLGMSRAAFAELVGVSPGSIFGWETGRTMPRGRSMARVVEVKKMGVRRARARVSSPAAVRERPRRRPARRTVRRPRRRAA